VRRSAASVDLPASSLEANLVSVDVAIERCHDDVGHARSRRLVDFAEQTCERSELRHVTLQICGRKRALDVDGA
jgi:hypothetical protein